MERNVVFSPIGAAEVGGAMCLLLSVRKVGTEALNVGDSTTRVGGEVDALATLPELDTEEIEDLRGAVLRLERKPCCAISTSGAGTTVPVAFLSEGFVLRDRNLVGKGM